MNGQLSQHVEYIPFGEVLFEEHSSSFSMPYLFNGKELDRETNLTYYGARYLDMKTSLWLNVDPLAEKFPGWSPYSFCNNNPLFFTDPDGRAVVPFDDIFSRSGRFLRSEGAGRAVKIEIGNKLYSPSQLANTAGSQYAIRKIGAHYARQAGVDGNARIGSKSDSEPSSKVPATTSGATININPNGGFSKALDNIDNFKSVLQHENFHKRDNDNPNFVYSNSAHVDVYTNQMSDKTFSSTTDDFKISMGGSIGNYILNLDRDSSTGQNDILSKIEKFNGTNVGGLQLVPQIMGNNYPKGTLELELQYKGQNYPIKYEKQDR